MIFVHVPKTAGTSLRESLARTGRHIVTIYGDIGQTALEATATKKDGHDPIFFGHVQFGVHERLGVPPVYATVLRNPIDRVISWYRHQAREEGLPFYRDIQNGMTLADVLTTGHTREISNHMTYIISGGRDCSTNSRSALEEAKHNLESFGFVGIAESLAKDLPRLAALLGTGWLRVSRHNAAPPCTEKWPRKAKEVVAEYNRLDLELYEYANEIARRQRAAHNSIASLLRCSGPAGVIGHYAWYYAWGAMPLPMKKAGKAIAMRLFPGRI
jgi:hypothetical protein